MSARAERIAQMLKDDDFQSVVIAYKARLTKKVMLAATSQEDRETALTHYHAIDAVMKGLRSEAQNIEKENANV